MSLEQYLMELDILFSGKNAGAVEAVMRTYVEFLKASAAKEK